MSIIPKIKVGDILFVIENSSPPNQNTLPLCCTVKRETHAIVRNVGLKFIILHLMTGDRELQFHKDTLEENRTSPTHFAYRSKQDYLDVAEITGLRFELREAFVNNMTDYLNLDVLRKINELLPSLKLQQ